MDLKGWGQTAPLGRTKNPHDIFINLDGSIEMAVRSKKPKAISLIKWLSKKGVEKIQEEHQQTIEEKDNQIQAQQQAIEEKDAAISLLNDDLQNREYKTVALQAQKDVYQNVKIPSPILKHVMFLMREILVKITLSSLYRNMQHLPTINIITCHIMLQGYNDVKGMLS